MNLSIVHKTKNSHKSIAKNIFANNRRRWKPLDTIRTQFALQLRTILISKLHILREIPPQHLDITEVLDDETISKDARHK